MKIWVLLFSLSVVQAVAAQNILSGGKLPKDLQITIDDTGTVQFANYRRFTISADGFVAIKYTSRGLPTVAPLELSGKDGKNKKTRPQKPPERKDRVSEEQLLDLARAIESSTFFQMQDRYYGNPTLESGACVNHSDAKEISVTANGNTKRVYFFLGCSYGEYEPLKRFLELYHRIETVIGGVKAREI